MASRPVLEVVLSESHQTKANGAGAATIGPIGPARSNETWVVDQISVAGFTSSPLVHALALINVNGQFRLGSRTGEADTASQSPPIVLGPSETLTVAWTGLLANSNATVTLVGSRQVVT